MVIWRSPYLLPRVFLHVKSGCDSKNEIFCSTTTRATKFSDAFKKSLAFWIHVGLASIPVQGPKISRCSFDGENRRDFQWEKWSESDSVILSLGWSRGSSGCFVFTPRSLQIR